MHAFAKKPQAIPKAALAKPKAPQHEPVGHSAELNATPVGGATRIGHDFARISIFPGTEPRSSPSIAGKSVDGMSEDREGMIDAKDGDPPQPAPAAPPAPAPAPAAPKAAGLASFTVKWGTNPLSGPTVAKLRLDFAAKFTKDATHDPASAEFRQNAGFKFEITDGPNKGQKSDRPLQDDNYSRTDDTAGHSKNDVDFVSNDNPGTSVDTPIDKDDVVDFTFTAEQMIIDTSANKVLKKLGPHIGTIKGKHPRTFSGVPAALS